MLKTFPVPPCGAITSRVVDLEENYHPDQIPWGVIYLRVRNTEGRKDSGTGLYLDRATCRALGTALLELAMGRERT